MFLKWLFLKHSDKYMPYLITYFMVVKINFHREKLFMCKFYLLCVAKYLNFLYYLYLKYFLTFYTVLLGYFYL